MANARKLLEKGDKLFTEGNLETALAAYDKALAADPFDSNALMNRGLALVQLKRYEEAIDNFNRLLEIEPYNSPPDGRAAARPRPTWDAMKKP